jgi:hypothetical protein
LGGKQGAANISGLVIGHPLDYAARLYGFAVSRTYPGTDGTDWSKVSNQWLAPTDRHH